MSQTATRNTLFCALKILVVIATPYERDSRTLICSIIKLYNGIEVNLFHRIEMESNKIMNDTRRAKPCQLIRDENSELHN